MRILLALLLSLAAHKVCAHAGSTSYLQLAVQGPELSGRWDIALRDLDYALGLDTDGDGAITWGELRQREGEVSAYALSRLRLDGSGHGCALQAQGLQVAEHNDGAYAVLKLSGRCDAAPLALMLEYQLFFDLDPTHRGLLNLDLQGARTAVFTPQSARQSFSATDSGAGTVFGQYLREGAWHVWTGWDHLLFIAALLLPAALRRVRLTALPHPTIGAADGSPLSRDAGEGQWAAAFARRFLLGGWRAAPSLKRALWDTAAIITAFTLAHASTLAFTALGWISLPTRWVEVAVAATVIFAGLNNLFPLVSRGLWLLALGFGFIHGTAIAGALLELGLPASGRVWALLAFNLGVEAAQLALAALVVPLSFVFRESVFYRRAVLVPGSIAISLIGLWWLVERVSG